MPPFQYHEFVNPYAASIGELLLHRGDAAAHAAEVIGSANARAAEIGGQAWGHAVENIGADIASTATRLTDPRRQLEQFALDKAKRDEAARSSLEGLMTPKMPSGPLQEGETREPQNPFLEKEGDVAVWKVDKLSEAMAAQGHGLSTENLQRISELNKAHREESSARAAFGQAQTNVVAKGAGTALSILRAHPDADPALVVDLVGQQMAANGTFPPEKIEATKQQLLSDPSQLHTKLEALSKAGAQPPIKLGKDEQLLNPNDVSGAPLATNVVDQLEKATFGIPQPDGSVKNVEGQFNKKTGEYSYQGQVVKDVVKPKEARPFSLDEQLYEAIAKGDTGTRDRILDTMKEGAKAKRDPVAAAQLEAIRSLSAQEAQARLDERDTTSSKSQAKFEQEYRTVLTRTLSSRSGGLGLEDQKVNQALHLLALFDQTKDPKTGDYKIPRMMQAEVALGLARLISPTGVPSEGIVSELNQRTAKGDIAGVVTYLTGQPVTGNTQAIFQSLRDSIERQAHVAESNRQTYLDSIKAFAPTDLNDERRAQVEKGLNLNSVPPSGAPARGTQRNGATWEYRDGKWGWWK